MWTRISWVQPGTSTAADRTVTIKQTSKIDELLDSAGMRDCNGVDTSAVANGRLAAQEEEGSDPHHNRITGQLLWLLQSRPDIGYAVNQLCRHGAKNGEEHIAYRKRIIRYLQRTRDRGLVLRGGQNLRLAGGRTRDGQSARTPARARLDWW
jgi:hypothetical protein